MKSVGFEAAKGVRISRFGVNFATSDMSAAPIASRSELSKAVTETVEAVRASSTPLEVTTISSTPAHGSFSTGVDPSCAMAEKASTSARRVVANPAKVRLGHTGK